MHKFDERDQFLAIVWMIFAVVFGVMIGLGLAAITSASVPIEDDCYAAPAIYLRTLSVSELQDPLISPKKEAMPESAKIAEPLYGPDLYRFYISQIHEQYYPEVDPYVALAVLEIESNYHPNVVSSAGAVGLMQWISKWHAWRMEKFHLNDPFDPYTNIIVGMDYLNDLYLSAGSWREALYGYNHSTAYVNAVLDKADSLRGGGYFG